MSITIKEHKLARSLFTNNFSGSNDETTVPYDRINDCAEPNDLTDKEIISALGGLQKKKYIVVYGIGFNSMISWTSKGFDKVDKLGPFSYD